jgi:hypothetical protein
MELHHLTVGIVHAGDHSALVTVGERHEGIVGLEIPLCSGVVPVCDSNGPRFTSSLLAG